MSKAIVHNLINEYPLVLEVYQYAKNLTYIDVSHDFTHSLRVLANALTIADAEGGDRELIAVAVLLHDAKNFPKGHPEAKNSSKVSAENAKEVLTKLGLSAERITIVYDAIYCHSFSLGKPPSTLEGKILQDADRIDSLGIIGIIRTFAVAGKMGSSFYHPEDPFNKDDTRLVDDRKYALDHFFQKLFTLEKTMQTNAGKALARLRTEKMRKIIIDDFSEEV